MRMGKEDESIIKSSNNNNKKTNKLTEVAIYGNYEFYYGYRVGKDGKKDERLKLFKKEYFENKDCLDIGCNSGVITIEIAKRFGCKSILGIDIDGVESFFAFRKCFQKMISNTSLATEKIVCILETLHFKTAGRVRDAFWNLRKTARMTNSKNSSMCKKTNFVSEEKDLFGIVTFEEGNFVQDWRSPENKCYHTILCLSVSKWIHLNWGDDGLITLFSKIWRHLHPGGIFILEPQPWESYGKKSNVSEVAKTNFLDIEIYPDSFQEILLDKIGFRKVENISSSLLGAKAGFARPILAFWK